jgi:hypothetical protein
MAPDFQKHVQSLLIPPRHPVLHRERSYSLPPGLALMSAEEATMIFSAAEKATSRRRRMVSVGPPFGRRPISDSGSNSSASSPEYGPVTPQNGSKDLVNQAAAHHVDSQLNFAWGADDATEADATEPFPALPVFPASPTFPRRLVGSPMEKTYADGLYEYTRSRLGTTVAPRFRIDSLTSDNHEIDQPSAKRVSRPALTSHFSDWSITTCDPLSRHGSRLGMSDPFEDDDDNSLDPFFHFDFLAPEPGDPGAATYASSEALVTSSTLPPPTPPSYPRPKDDEISYFSNFEYLHESPKQPQRPSRKTKPVTFTLSPMPSPADTTVGDASELDAEASVGTNGGAVQGVGEGVHTARIAVRVPNALIGTV